MRLFQEYILSFLDMFSAYPYMALFVGMIIAGELVLLPAIYLAATQRIDLAAVLLLAIIATMLSDCLWYGLGRRFPASTLARVSGKVGEGFFAGAEKAFSAGGKRLLFMSKFIYGTRALAQVLAGVHRMPLRSYLVVNTAGVIAVTVVLTVIAYSVIGTTYRLGEVMQYVEVAFLLFVLVTIGGYILVGNRLRKQWSL
ncbi:DedA family protein [Pseudohongiella acticola]|jgi:membrane-associated protein|nr:VTT domain-containing protein [Pseudohongiella acticola]